MASTSDSRARSTRIRLNALYASVQAIFWIVCCPIVGFGSAYLLERGFTSAEIGIMLGIANVLALAIQPVLSARSDADERFSPVRITMAFTAAIGASSLVQLLLMPTGIAMGALWTFSAACAIAANAFVTAVKFQIDEDGAIDFGTCRAIGSTAWGVLSAGLGFAVERLGMRLIPLMVCIAVIAFFALLAACERRSERASQEGPSRFETAGEASSWAEFIRSNRWLIVLLAGIGLVYLHHALANYFSIMLVENVGGDESDMGLIIALAAVLEIPGMVLYSRIEKRVPARGVLLFALTAFTVKAVALWCAADVAQLTGAYSIQLFSYGLFTASSVSFASQATRPGDLVKAQTCFTLVTTASGIFSSFAGGVMIQTIGVDATLLFAAASAIAGICLAFFSMGRVKTQLLSKGQVV